MRTIPPPISDDTLASHPAFFKQGYLVEEARSWAPQARRRQAFP